MTTECMFPRHALFIAIMFLIQSSDRASQRFDELAAQSQSKLMGRLLGTMVTYKYPMFKEGSSQFDLSLDDLLEWYLWPNFLQIYGTYVIPEDNLQ